MAVNKNFVVKNGLEVNDNLIYADATINKVGVGTILPQYELEVIGGIGVSNFYAAAVADINRQLNVGSILRVNGSVAGIGGSIAIGDSYNTPEYFLDIRPPGVGQTSVYIEGIVKVTDTLSVNNLTSTGSAEVQSFKVNNNFSAVGPSTFSSRVSANNGINVSGTSTLSAANISGALNVTGVSTFNNYVNVAKDINISGNLNASGISTIQNIDISLGASFSNISVSGASTFTNSVNFNNSINSTGIATFSNVDINGGNIDVDTITADNINVQNLNLSGIATLSSANISGNLSVDSLTASQSLQVGDISDIVINGINNTIVGVTTLTSTNANVTNLNSTNVQTTNLVVSDNFRINGVNTSTSGVTTVTINGSSSGISTSYELYLPETLGTKGQVLALKENGVLEFANSLGLFANRIYVSAESGDDANDGKSAPVKTIKRASQLASSQAPVTIIVESGEYVENNPIILYENVALIGDNLRTTIIRPLNAGKDLFRVRNGCYVTNLAMKDYIDNGGVPQHTFDWAVAFDDPADSSTSRTGYAVNNTKPVITRSPYIQNCSILSFLGGNGILVDGSKVLVPNTSAIPEESENPVVGPQPEFGKSMVAATFTMVSFGGVGWKTINDGYAQVVSCFQIFCKYGSLVQSGGYLSITNSATNFGLYALKASGYNANCYDFDKGVVASTGTIAGQQSLKVVGLKRADQDLYVLRFINRSSSNDETGLFKPLTISREVNIATGVNTTTNTIQITSHGFVNEDKVLYIGNPNASPPSLIGGLIDNNEYYVKYVNDNQFELYEDDSLSKIVDLTSFGVGINTFQKGGIEFFNQETVSSHNSYQIIGIATTSATLNFVPGRAITQTVSGGTASGYVYDYNALQRRLIVSVEQVDGVRYNFGVTGVGTNSSIQDHSNPSIGIAITSVASSTEYYTSEFKVNATDDQSSITNIANLPESYNLQFHRPSIINSSSHTWEFSGAGTDYNALPQNGGKANPSTEQVSALGGRVYASGTNELGDFKIGDQITAFNRTGNIVFQNKVEIAEIDSINLSLSGGVTIKEFSTDIGLGDNEIGGAKNDRVSTQLAVKSFLNNRLGDFIDKNVTTNAIPNGVLQLNSLGQINPDLIPPRVVSYYTADVGGGRTTLVDRIPAVDISQGDTVVEPGGGYTLVSGTISEFLVLNNSTANYNFNNGDEVISTLSAGSAIGIVTAPTSVGYGTTGLVKGVLLSLNNLNGGSGYSNPGIYTSIPLTSITGTGTSALASITINESGVVSNVEVTYGGRGYVSGNTLSASSGAIGGISTGGSAFQVNVNNVQTRLYLKLTNSIQFPGTASLTDYIKDNNSVGISTSLTTSLIKSFNPTSINSGGDVDFDNDRIVVGINSFSDGDPVIYSSETGTVLSELISGSTYYIKKVGISSVELYSTYALSSKLSLLSSGIGTHTLTRAGVNTASNQLVVANHGFATGDAVRVTGNTPVGVTTNSFYFVGSITANSFTLHGNQTSAVGSVNGSTISPIDITSGGVGTITFTKQNVSYNNTVNTSSSVLSNWNALSSAIVDAQNIVSGTISPDRLGSGVANNDTFLAGDSSYKKVIKSVSIASTEPITVVSSSSQSGSGITTHYGDLRITLDKVQSSVSSFSTYGISRFKSSNFSIDSEGGVSIKNSSNGGDIDAVTLNGQSASYYLDINNITGSVPITRGGTGLSALPSNGHLLVGNGSSYNLTGSPTIAGTLTGGISIPANSDVTFTSGTWSGDKASKIQYFDNDLYLQYTGNLIARNSSGTNRMTLTSGGDVTFSGSVNASSDRKLKENIKTIENALDKTVNLRGVEFDRKDTGEHQIGVIAQEVEEIIPEVVYDNDGTKSVAYGNIVAVLIEAIKEQQNEIDGLKNSIQELKEIILKFNN